MNKFQREFVNKVKDMGVDVVGMEEGGKHTKLLYRTPAGAVHRFPMARMATTCSMRNALSSLRRSAGLKPEPPTRTLFDAPATLMGVPVVVERVPPAEPPPLAPVAAAAQEETKPMSESNGHAKPPRKKRHQLTLPEYIALQKFVGESWGVIEAEKPPMTKFAKEASQALGFDLSDKHLSKIVLADGREWPSVTSKAMNRMSGATRIIGKALVQLYAKLGEEMPSDLRQLVDTWK